MANRISIAIPFLSGLGLIFIGARFLISPEIAEAAYGIQITEQGQYSFHYIKGNRDLFSGMLICFFVWSRQLRALGITLVT